MIPRRIFLVLVLALAVGMLAKAGEPVPPEDRVLLEIGKKKFSVADFQLYLKQINPLMNFGYLPASEQQHWLDEYVRQKLLAQQARAAGLERDPEVRARIEFFVERVLGQAFQEKVVREIAVSEEELTAYYCAHGEEFRTPARVRLEHFLYRTPEKAEQARTRLEAGATYAEMAEEKRSNADVLMTERGWFTADLLLPALAEAAFALPPGGASDVIHTGYGYHVVRVEAREESGIEEFDAVRTEVLDRLRQEKARRLFQRLLEDAHTEQGVRLHTDSLVLH